MCWHSIWNMDSPKGNQQSFIYSACNISPFINTIAASSFLSNHIVIHPKLSKIRILMPIITFSLPSILVCVNIFAGNTQFLWFLSTCMNEECKWGIHLILSTTVLNWLIILRFALPNKITILEFRSKICTAKVEISQFINRTADQRIFQSCDVFNWLK